MRRSGFLVDRRRHVQRSPVRTDLLSFGPMSSIINVSDVTKTYASGFQALKHVNLEIRHGEIFALLGPNGAGKTTLISIVCGIVTATKGKVTVDGHDIVSDF